MANLGIEKVLLVLRAGNTGARGGQFGNDNAVGHHDINHGVHSSILDFEKDAVASSYERARIVKPDGTVVDLSGEHSSIPKNIFNRSVRQAMRGATFSHNHPGYVEGSGLFMIHGFSAADLHTAVAGQVAEMRAVDKDFIYSFKPGNKYRGFMNQLIHGTFTDALEPYQKHQEEFEKKLKEVKKQTQYDAADKANSGLSAAAAEITGGTFRKAERLTGRVLLEWPRPKND